MVKNKTYNNVVNTLLRLGEYHKEISTTSVGDIYDVDLSKMTKFPLLHLNPTNVSTGDSQLTYNFQIFIMDMVTEKADWTKNNASADFPKLVKTLSNEQDVFNDTLQICTDFISMLRHSVQQSLEGTNDINAPIYFTQDQFTIEPFSERFDNLCCGWVLNIGILVQNDFQSCNIPVNSSGAGY
tara:strand:- start:24 stop:572 length:549 start_codon:yes stop_codon:yes gene_type:complete